MNTLETKVRERTQELENMHFDVLAALAQAFEARDLGTSGHCKRVCPIYAELIAGRLDLDSEQKRHLHIRRPCSTTWARSASVILFS